MTGSKPSTARMWRLAGAAMAAMCVLALVTWAPAAQPGPQIEIGKHKYSQPTLTVPVGTTVTWVNRDDDVHTVVSRTQAFTSRGMDTDESFSFTFTKPGVYDYFCTLHPLMTGKVIVK